jgi:hypothetical protein
MTFATMLITAYVKRDRTTDLLRRTDEGSSETKAYDIGVTAAFAMKSEISNSAPMPHGRSLEADDEC